LTDCEVSDLNEKRYRRQDEIGTPFCITIDNDSLTDNAATIRDRDTMQQERIPMDQSEGVFAGEVGVSETMRR
jgi:glycyl-tRNA synthetase